MCFLSSFHWFIFISERGWSEAQLLASHLQHRAEDRGQRKQTGASTHYISHLTYPVPVPTLPAQPMYCMVPVPNILYSSSLPTTLPYHPTYWYPPCLFIRPTVHILPNHPTYPTQPPVLPSPPYLSYNYLGSSVCHPVCHPVCRPVVVAERWVILYVLAIKLTKETRRRVCRGRD